MYLTKLRVGFLYDLVRLRAAAVFVIAPRYNHAILGPCGNSRHVSARKVISQIIQYIPIHLDTPRG